MRRASVLTAALLVVAVSLVGCAKDTGSTGSGGSAGAATECRRNPSPTGGAAPAAPPVGGVGANASALRVGLSYDVGGRGDASFNDAAAAGLDRAKAQLGVTQDKELTAAVGESEDASAGRLRQLVADGYNPIIAVGFKYEPAVEAVAPGAPNVKFALIDSTANDLPNVTPLVFAEEQGSFLVGAAAALKTKSCHIGFVGGVQTPLIQKFEAGFKQGAKAVAPDIKIETSYLSQAGDLSGFNDPAKGGEATKGELDAGADVVYAAAGASGSGAFRAIKAASTPQNPKWGIGVDSDQYNDKTLADVRDVIMTSMVKRVDVAVYDFISAVASNQTNNIPKVFDLKVDGVGYATSGGFVDDIKSQLDAYKAQIISGAIKVSATPEQ
ncbi:MAG TPA: BMP family ABC transporter substrate-binding protein [Pseudonocardia sp.]|uniref:BMP family lipoprotein n=1 Tax=Pseudonocardia sp. TaxID=60912 RepID=UPI002BD62B48|nr:BMP family ABC transporter substrate-binding protein [Pseudonocardia sp.]HTF46362.1 BMP family ABC transporter substrate-binding protein [Pseudonocardia sp.]